MTDVAHIFDGRVKLRAGPCTRPWTGPARTGGDAEVAVALTFDVDGEAPWLGEGPEYGRRLTLLSRMLESVITGMTERGRPWFATHAQIAGQVHT